MQRSLIRGEQVLLDSDVAEIYEVETKRINEAVKNNPDKFPDEYSIELRKDEWDSLKSKFSTSKKGGKVKSPKAFTERGLYMLATILKSKQAVQTTLAIDWHILQNSPSLQKHGGIIKREQ